MKRNKFVSKIVCAILMGTMVVTSIIGCSQKTETSTATTQTSSKQEGVEGTKEDKLEGNLVSEKPVELGIHMHYWDSEVFDDNWKVFKKAAELTNVTLKGTAPTGASSSGEVFNMMIASGDIPDIVNGRIIDLKKYAGEGAFLPLNDMLEEHAPDFNKFLEENPDIKKSIANPDGNIYIIPYVEANPVGKAWFMRKDWLDKFSLEVPTTVDELYTALKTFIDKDANGNGIKDETGYFSKDAGAGTRDLLGLFGVPETWYIEDGKVVSGQYMPELKDAMIEISKWYKEGLIDKEIFTRGGKAREEMFGQNIGAMTHDWTPSTSNFNNSMTETVPGFELVAIAPPNAQLGAPWEYSSPTRVKPDQQGIAIGANTKHPEIALKYLNFWWTEEGRNLANFGVEGEEYVMVDGKPQYIDEFLNSSDKPVVEKLKAIGAQRAFAYEMDYDYVIPTLHPEAVKAAEMYSTNGYIADTFPMLTFTEEEQQVIDKKYAAIQSYYSETIQKWVLGSMDVETTFDEYMTQMKALGMEEVIGIYQAAYERYMGQ